ncbi:hypothetical protein GcM3_086029, partial [Golovinomyces cichoracearum]
INDTAGPKGLVPTLLVFFGAYSRIINLDAPAVSVEQRARAYRNAIKEVRNLRVDRQIKDALNMRNGPITSAIRDLPLQSQVLVWREGISGKKGSWEGPHLLVGIDENTCIVQFHQNSDKLSSFRITSVKPYLSSPNREINDDNSFRQNDDDSTHKIHHKKDVTPSLPGIVNRNVTFHVERDQIPPGAHIYRVKFIDEIKIKNSNDWFEKSRLCIAAWGDKEKWTVLTQSPTIQRASQRAILAIAPMMMAKGLIIYDRDVEQ